MSRGPFFELCRRAAIKAVFGGLVVTGLCAGVLALNQTVLGGATGVAWVFAPGLAFGLLLTAFSGTGWLWPHRGALFLTLKRHSDPAAIAAEIDHELVEAAIDGRTGDIWLTRSWLVGLMLPRAFRLADVVGVGIGPINPGRWRIVCWARGEEASHKFEASPAEAQRIRDGLRLAAPDLLVADIDAFEARWSADRLVCEAAALARGTTAEPPQARTA